MENNMRAKTEMSSTNREARTTEAEMAALIDRTEDSLRYGDSVQRRDMRLVQTIQYTSHVHATPL